jgi:hypothetical protein
MPRRSGVTTIECRGPGVQELVAFALPFRDRAPRAIDVCLRPRMPAVEEEHAGPDADGQLVLSCEVVVEAGEKQAFDARVSLAFRQLSRFGEVVGTKRVRHRKIVKNNGRLS